MSGGVLEKDIALAICRATEKALKAAGLQVTLTRDGDVEQAGKRYQWRLDKATGSDVLVSVHVNASDKPTANGFQVFYKPRDAGSKALAKAIQRQNSLFKDRGIAEGRYTVLQRFKGAAVLIEAGFITNPNDLNLLQSNDAEIGRQVGEGILQYLQSSTMGFQG